MPVSVHRALASASDPKTPAADASSSDSHTSAVGRLQKVTMPQPAPDNTQPQKVTPVNLGKDQSRTDMTVVGDESKGFAGLATQ